MYTCTLSLYTIFKKNISSSSLLERERRRIPQGYILCSPDAGHSGHEESEEWLDFPRGVTIVAVHNIPPCSTDECEIEHFVK